MGKAKLSASSSEGKTILLKVAGAGEVLGLSANVSGTPYDFTIETIEPTQANFIGRNDFLNFLTKFPGVGLRVAQQLTNSCHSAFEEVRSFGLSRYISERLARLVIHWTQTVPFSKSQGSGEVLLKVALSQEEIAQMIGSSRETVSRSLGN